MKTRIKSVDSNKTNYSFVLQRKTMFGWSPYIPLRKVWKGYPYHPITGVNIMDSILSFSDLKKARHSRNICQLINILTTKCMNWLLCLSQRKLVTFINKNNFMLEFKGGPSVKPIRDEFKKSMDIEFNDIWDKMFLMYGKISIDIIKLDDILHRRFGDYKNDGKSMRNIVEDNYGKEISDLIESLT